MDIFYSKCQNTKEIQHETGRKIIYYAAKKIYNLNNPVIEIHNNKPRFKNSDIYFSISHSFEMVTVCFDKFEVGADIEKIRPRDYQEIAKRMKFKLKNNTLDDFYEEWTLYEAKYKLQTEAKETYSFNLGEYKISVASSETTDIKNNIKLYDITSCL